MPTVTIGDNTGDDFSGTDDTHIQMASPTTNYGSTTTFKVQKYAAGDHNHALLRFPGISNLPDILSVSSATIGLYTFDGSVTYTIEAKKLAVARDWVELEATWNIWKTSNSWTTAGALSEPNDRSATVSVSLSCNTTVEYKLFSSAQLAADVEDFADGTLVNNGWHFARADAGEDSGSRRFYASEHATDGRRPYLSVTYTEAGGGGELALFVDGLIA